MEAKSQQGKVKSKQCSKPKGTKPILVGMGICLGVSAFILLICLAVAILVILLVVLPRDDGFYVTGTLGNFVSGRRGDVSITHVFANSPLGEGQESMRINEVTSDGVFILSLEPDVPWVLEFLDTNEVGKEMVKGIFTTDTVRTVYPQVSSSTRSTHLKSITLHEVPVNETYPEATIGSNTYVGFLEDLGLTEETATFLSMLDSTCLRNSNPDVDGDGVVDVLQEDFPDYSFRILNEYQLDVFPGDNMIDLLKNGDEWPTSDFDLAHVSSQLLFRWYPTAKTKESMQELPRKVVSSWEVNGECPTSNTTVEDSGSGYESTGSGGCYLMNPSVFEEWRNDRNLGLIFTGIEVLPSGTFEFALYENADDPQPSETLTFTHVVISTNTSDLHNFLFMFLSLGTDDPTDTITSLTYEWKKYDTTARVFTETNPQEIEAFMGKAKASVDIVGSLDVGMTFELDPRADEFAVSASSEDWYSSQDSPALNVADIAYVTQRYTLFSGVEYSLTIGTV